jgi:hypothetical protein
VSRWRKKRVVVDAWQFLPATQCEELPEWIDPGWFHEDPGVDVKAGGTHSTAHRGTRYMRIPAPGGTLRADYTDWIIHGVNGEVYPCKADVFAASYEPV